MNRQTSGHLVVVYTGGTIGMVPTDEGWRSGADMTGWLTALLGSRRPLVSWQMVTLEPLIDSANATPDSWQRIADAIRAHQGVADAFVVLHGSDTMATTTAALHYALADLATTVVVTGAQHSLLVPDSDAPGNVLGAVDCALDERVSGVALFFGNQLYAPLAVTKISTTRPDGFDSLNREPLAAIRPDGGLAVQPDARRGTTADPVTADPLTADPLTVDPGTVGPPAPFGEVDIAILTLHPGLRAERVRAMLTPTPQAVVLRAYGSGNVPDEDAAMMAVLQEATRAGSVLVVTTQCPHGGVELGRYAASQPLLAAGAVSAGRLTTEALVALLTHQLGQGHTPEQVRAAVEREAAAS